MSEYGPDPVQEGNFMGSDFTINQHRDTFGAIAECMTCEFTTAVGGQPSSDDALAAILVRIRIHRTSRHMEKVVSQDPFKGLV